MVAPINSLNACRINRSRDLVIAQIRDKVPDAFRISRRRAKKRRAVVNLDRAIDLRSSGQRNDVYIGDTVTDDAAVDRLQADRRSNRRYGIDNYNRDSRGCARISRSIGGRCGETMIAIGKH